MKKFILTLKYIANVLSAITKGIDVVIDNWPSDSPFTSSKNSKKQDEPIHKDFFTGEQIQDAVEVHEGTSQTGDSGLHEQRVSG